MHRVKCYNIYEYEYTDTSYYILIMYILYTSTEVFLTIIFNTDSVGKSIVDFNS